MRNCLLSQKVNILIFFHEAILIRVYGVYVYLVACVCVGVSLTLCVCMHAFVQVWTGTKKIVLAFLLRPAHHNRSDSEPLHLTEETEGEG